MNPQLVLLLLQAISQSLPDILADFQKGNVTPEMQAQILAEHDKIKDMFAGPEWQVS